MLLCHQSLNFSVLALSNLEVFCKKKIIDFENDDKMEVDIEPDNNKNYQEYLFLSGSETEESDCEDFFPEEEMITIDISFISQ